MLKRTITGAFIVAIVVGFFFLRGIDYRLFNIMFLAMSLVGTFEMLRATKEKTCTATRVITFICGVASVPLTTFFGVTGLAILCGGYIVAMLFSIVICYDDFTVENVGTALFCFIYPNILVSVMALMNGLDNDIARYGFIALVLSFAVCPITDVFAYLVGSLLHGPKMCPKISPNKTISGGIGGIVGGIVASVIVYFVLKAFDIVIDVTFMPSILLFIIIGAVASAFTEIGDLVESAIKRKTGIKDMGKMFPGHGGMLDRIDGLMFASSFIYLAFKLLVTFA